jgi:hypothetical protein
VAAEISSQTTIQPMSQADLSFRPVEATTKTILLLKRSPAAT